MASNSSGLHLGTESADLVTLGGSFQHPRLISFGRVQLPSQGSWRSQIRAEESPPAAGAASGSPPSPTTGGMEPNLPEAVKTLLNKAGTSSRHLYTAVASETVVIRYFQMPLIPAHERKMAIAFEAKKYLPFKLEELITDFQVVIQKTDASLMRVMFFGIKKNAATAILSLLRAAGITPLCLEPAPISLMRLLRQSGQLSAGQVAAILSVERGTATISIARGELLYLSRNVTMMSPAETESPGSLELFEALMNETRVSIDYYKRRFLGEPAVSKVILFGQATDAKKLEELTAGLNLPVEIGDPFRRIAGGKEVPSGLAIATGLALRGLEKKTRQTNLLPIEQRRDVQRFLKPLLTECIAAGVILGAWYAISMADLSVQEQKIQALQAQEISSPYFRRGLGMAQIQSFQAEQQAQASFLRKIADSQGQDTAILIEVARLLPQEGWLQKIFLEDLLGPDRKGVLAAGSRRRTLKLGGGAYLKNRDAELEEVNRFLSSLRSSTLLQPAFSDFQMNSVQRGLLEEEDVTEFHVTCSSQPEETPR